MISHKNRLPADDSHEISCSGPLADSHEIKGFFIKAILGKIKVISLKFLQKIKSKSSSNIRVISSDPDL